MQELGGHFIPKEYLPVGKDEFYLRNRQNATNTKHRKLTAHEIEVLVRNRNTADDWNNILVSDAFAPELVKNCQFFGLVRIGKLEPFFLEFHDVRTPVGLYDSSIINCDFGDNVVIKNVHYFAHYITGDEVIIANVNEISTSSHAKFGNGILKEGEKEEVRIWLEICNENGGRSVMPFDGMLPGDAWLWSRNRHNEELQRRFREMTEKKFDSFRGYYGTLGNRTVIKNCSIIKDVKTGPNAYIKGANKLKNLTINSSAEAQTQIGEGCELVNGIIGLGCRIFYGVKAVRFIMGSNSQLKYGARLINSYLGDNATISCCEVLNSLIFPAHEQHHNNSFLIAATIEGQSNIAAGATIGSNHNSRAADGEVIAARGFWPGLCTSIKHNSKFAPFTLLAKSDFPHELNITLPFSLVSNDASNDQLVIMPAFYLMYNLYALERNTWKTSDRDKRPDKQQMLEMNYLAPDTVNSMFEALKILEILAGRTILAAEKPEAAYSDIQAQTRGKELIKADDDRVKDIKTPDFGFEHGNRICNILKINKAHRSYHDFILIYAVETILEYLNYHPDYLPERLAEDIGKSSAREPFTNIGGQLMPTRKLEILKQMITDYDIISWDEVHRYYHTQADQYPADKYLHAMASLNELLQPESINRDLIQSLLTRYLEMKERCVKSIEESRLKDYENPFRSMVYENKDEMFAVLGKPANNAFIKMQKQRLSKLKSEIHSLLERWKRSHE